MTQAIENIPEHLSQYIAKQKPELYTPMDHACWRFILKISQNYLNQFAHEKYIEGLKKTGISTDRIPLITEMDDCLRKFGWRAVAVSGFIPPSVFMEFHSLGILPIACDMRKIENLAYTPAPDIVHEAAGHAPLLSDPEYLEYLKRYGEIAKKSIYSEDDIRVYECIRNLSDIKEKPDATNEEIQKAQDELDDTIAHVSYVSEATYLARMYWWTVEYGLVGTLSNPSIYGAGLLSSASESFHCLSQKVKKIPFSIDAIHMSYDITRPQPQLFVTPDFKTLIHVLEEYADRMAFRRGGDLGLTKALTARTLISTQLSSGIQITSILTDLLQDAQGNHCYLIFKGPTQLSFEDKQLPEHGKNYHKEGFSTPIGPLEKTNKNIEDLTLEDLKTLGIELHKNAELHYQSGVTVRGTVKKIDYKKDKLILISFSNAEVRFQDKILFQPAWGDFDLACGTTVQSVFGGPADAQKYYQDSHSQPKHIPNHKTNLTQENKLLNEYFQKIRTFRNTQTFSIDELEKIYENAQALYPNEWLLKFEILELIYKNYSEHPLTQKIKKALNLALQKNQNEKELIERGLKTFL